MSVVVGDDTFRADTWSVHDHHYALVRIEHLAPCTASEYRVALNDHQVWPLEDSEFPPSVIRAIDPDAPFRLAFGSCRRSDPLDDEHFATIGADALVGVGHPDGRDAALVVAR